MAKRFGGAAAALVDVWGGAVGVVELVHRNS
jgi:hypothetical protein